MQAVYQTIIGKGLDDEYEKTFVEVYILLFQSNTKFG